MILLRVCPQTHVSLKFLARRQYVGSRIHYQVVLVVDIRIEDI